MTIPLRVTAADVRMPEDVLAALRARTDRLEHYFERIVGCRAMVSGGRGQFGVRLVVGVPSREIAVTRRHGGDLMEAVHVAFDAVERQLASHARRLRREGREGSRVSCAGPQGI